MRHVHIDTDNFRLDQDVESAGDYRFINKKKLMFMVLPSHTMAHDFFLHAINTMFMPNANMMLCEYWDIFECIKVYNNMESL